MFWAFAILITIGSMILILRPLARSHGPDPDAATPDVSVYRDQLSEVETDEKRGVLQPEEAAALRIEISRRLLQAADADAPKRPAQLRPNLWMIAVVILLIASSFGLYTRLGHPGIPDQPLSARIAEQEELRNANRPTQEQAEDYVLAQQAAAPQPQIDPQALELLDQLRTILQSRPDDLRGHRLLATNLAQLGKWAEARATQGQVLRILGEDAVAADFTDHAEYMILAAAGYVSVRAEATLIQALERNPEDPRARYYSGHAAWQANRPDLTYDLWARLLEEGPADAPWVAAIQAQLPDVARAAGRPALPGPGADDIAAAAQMDAADRENMVRSMVEGLSERLATEGGSADEWARLIRAYGVLNQTDKAQITWDEARETFADMPEDLGVIRQAALSIGLAE